MSNNNSKTEETNFIGSGFHPNEEKVEENWMPTSKETEKGHTSKQSALNAHLDVVNKVHRTNVKQSLIKTIILSFLMLSLMLGLYYAIHSEGLSITSPVGADENVIQELSEQSLRLTRIREIISVNSSFLSAASSSKNELLKKQGTVKDDKYWQNERLINVLYGPAEIFGFSLRGQGNDQNSKRVLEFRITYLRQISEKNSPKESIKYELFINTPYFDETTSTNYITSQGKNFWLSVNSQPNKKLIEDLDLSANDVVGGYQRQATDSNAKFLIQNNNPEATQNLISSSIEELEQIIHARTVTQTRMESLEKQLVKQMNSRLVNVLSGNSVYLFDIAKRSTMMLLITAVILTFLRRLNSEIQFMNLNISKHFTFICMESSRFSLPEQIEIQNGINENGQKKSASDDDSTPTIPGSLFSYLKALFQKN